MHVHRDMSVEGVGGYREEFSLSWADGMVGVLPIFDTKENAEAYSKGRAFVAEADIMETEYEA